MIPGRLLGTSVLVNGDEVDGFIIYGLWVNPSADTPAPPVAASEATQLRRYVLRGDGWLVHECDIAYPDGATTIKSLLRVEGLLDQLLAAGADVAWVGSEATGFADPPELFSAEAMRDSVIAAKTSPTWTTRGSAAFVSGAHASGIHRLLDASQMKTLARVVEAIRS